LTESREDAAPRGIAEAAARARKLAETEPDRSASGPAARRAVLDDTLDPREMASAVRFADAAKAANTRRAYAADWADFGRWATARGADPLPCPPGLLCGYLAALADAGLRASTITRHAAAIAHQHRAAGFDPPTASPAVREVLRGIRHTHGTAPARKAPATAALIARMLAACPDTMIGLRDRALLALGFAGAFRRSELLALEVADLSELPDGLRVVIRRSKTDPEAEGQEIAIIARQPAVPGRDAADLAHRGGDHRRAAVPPGQQGRHRRPLPAQHRWLRPCPQAPRRSRRPRSRPLRRSLAARRFFEQCRRFRRRRTQNGRGVAP
jgi:integrase